MRRREPAPPLSVRQKVTLFHNTAMPASAAAELRDEEVTYEVLSRHGVRAPALVAAGFGPLRLKEAGMPDATSLRRMGFSALHLCDETLASEAIAAFGADEVVGAFVASPEDAVAIAGEEAAKMLDVTVPSLLELCAGSPQEALAVLQQVLSPDALAGVSRKLLLDTGLRAPQLKRAGYTLALLTKTPGTPEELAKLGCA